jgi:hypothetical protein
MRNGFVPVLATQQRAPVIDMHVQASGVAS